MHMTFTAESRRSEILDVLRNERYLKVVELSQRFGVSQMSIRRDICLLEKQGLLRRVHGGLVATPLSRLGLEIPAHFIAQLQEANSMKQEIARAAASLVGAGDHLIFDSGDLSYLAACTLSGDLLMQGDLAAITNSIPVALELAPWPGVETILLGGEYQASSTMSLVGPDALRGLDGLHADKMFLTPAGIAVDEGIQVWSRPGESDLARRMLAACSQVILMAPGEIVGRRLPGEYLPLEADHTLVTGEDCPQDVLSALRDAGMVVILVKENMRKELCL
jgi:DeoR/GlpR family transcriptional regulator of sugar metabolism